MHLLVAPILGIAFPTGAAMLFVLSPNRSSPPEISITAFLEPMASHRGEARSHRCDRERTHER